MHYDFDEVVDRAGTHSLKWDVAEGELPMWVADMDFRTAPAVQEALVRRAQHGVFGYSIVPDAYKRSIVRWWQERHGLGVCADHLIFATGVVATLSSVVRSLTNVAEKVVLMTPVYNCFYSSILNNGRRTLESPLIYEEGRYRIDFADLEEKMADPQATMLILCNPHNPTGNVWTAEELARIGELCERHHLVVVSDEIHCELTRPGMSHVPFASVNECCRMNSVTCCSPSKAFNIAGLQSSYVFVDNDAIRARVERGLNTDEVAEPNAFAIDSTIAAYGQGATWLDELRAYLQDNKDLLARFVAEEIPGLRMTASDATYLCWVDCSGLTDDTSELQRVIRKETGLFVTQGGVYGEVGKRFLRINVATTRANLEDGLRRLKAGCEAYRASR